MRNPIIKGLKIIPEQENKGLKQLLKLSFILILVQALIILFSLSFLPSQVPLFYSRPWGEEQLAHPLYLFILPLANLAVFILNSILLSFIEKKELLIRQILIICILLFNFLSLITLIQIVRLII